MTHTIFLDAHSYVFSRRFPFDVRGRPVVELLLRARDKRWLRFLVVADTGADATLMSESDAALLGIPDITYSAVDVQTMTGIRNASLTAYFHRIRATVRGSGADFPMLVGFSPDVGTRLFGRPDMLKQFVIAFDSGATYFMRD